MCWKKTMVALLVLFAAGCTARQSAVEGVSKEKLPKNIILMIGDGMGLTQITAGLVANDFKLQLERVPYIGLSKTFASDALVTDSAAGATALSVGEKTYNGAIGVLADSTAKETILETGAMKGLATGLIATSTITHATPASFFAHQPSRSMNEEIAADMIKSPLHYFIGGGKKYFANRADGSNILPDLEKAGFSFVENATDFESSTATKIGWFISDENPVPVKEGRGDVLSEAVEVMLPKLAGDEDGFFLMVEGSQIDWGGHSNDSEYIVSEMMDFDKAIGKVLDFAEKDGNTLVIITADHETGGYALGASKDDRWAFEPAFTTGSHTAVMVPVFAFGPGAASFSGIYENTEIYHKMVKAFGWK